MSSLTVVTAAAIDPLSVGKAKDYLAIPADDGGHDDLVRDIIAAATASVEVSLDGRQLMRATYDWKLDGFPPGGMGLWVPKPPLSSVTSITYIDTAGDSQTLSTDNYDVDTSSMIGRIVEDPDGTGWPATKTGQIDSVTVRLVAGYGTTTDSVPPVIRLAINQTVDYWFANRSGFVSGSVNALPHHVTMLLQQFRTGRVA